MTDLVPSEDSGKHAEAVALPAKRRAVKRSKDDENPSSVCVQNGSALPISSDVRELEKRIEEGHAALATLAAEFIGRTLPKAREVGELLNAWKKVLGHGQLGENLLGLQSRIGLSPRTARSYMQIAKDWKKLKQVAGDTISDLSIRAALRMVSGVRRNNKDTDGNQNNCIDAKFVVVGVSESVDEVPPNLVTLGKSQTFRAYFGAAILDPWGVSLRYESPHDLSPSDVRKLPVTTVLQPSSHVFLLTRDDELSESLRTLKAWGFSFSHSLVIARKVEGETPSKADSDHYFVLCSTRSAKPFRSTNLSSWIDAAGDNMEEIRKRVELAADGPFLQVFGEGPLSSSGWSAASTIQESRKR